MDLTLAKSSRAERRAAAMGEAIALLKTEGVRFSQPDKYTLISAPTPTGRAPANSTATAMSVHYTTRGRPKSPPSCNR